ncbi:MULTISPECIES: hypothetical protein [unclassified Streptomyces]|uniref:hypothetical protein n=1 Tax=unclassified Streptomyces TaxID=2593676 RepID=UPI00381C2A89
MALLLLVITALVVWAVNFRDGGGGSRAGGPGGHTPVPSITPGPSASGPLNSSRPGGSIGGSSSGGGSSDGAGDSGATDGSSSGGGTGDTGGSDAGGSSGDSGANGGSADGGTDSSSGGGSSSGVSGSGGSGSGGGVQLPAGSSLPNCAASSVTLGLRSERNSYEPGEKPTFVLTATNSSDVSCKLDFGPAAAVFTVSDTDDNHRWASDDCPRNRSGYLLQVPAHSSTTYELRWDRTTSSPQCATPKVRTAPLGTYLVEAKLPGFQAKQTSFVLKDA